MMNRLLVIHFEQLSLADLGCYGLCEVETPFLDQFAAESVVFDQHYCGMKSSPSTDTSRNVNCDLDEEAAAELLMARPNDEQTLTINVRNSDLSSLDRSGICNRFLQQCFAGFDQLNDPPAVVITAKAGCTEIDQLPIARNHAIDLPLQQELRIHIPLLVRFPDRLAGRRQSLTSSADSLETLLPLARGEQTQSQGSLVIEGENHVGLRTRGFYLIAERECLEEGDDFEPSGVQLFSKPDDFWNVHNVAAQDYEQTRLLMEQLREELSSGSDG